jgi:hypothetical protein
MGTLSFEEVAKLINHSRVTTIEYERPHAIDEGRWALYRGVNKVPNFSYDFQVLFLFAAATKDSLPRVMRYLDDSKQTQVVYAPSLERRIKKEEIQRILGNKVTRVADTKSYLRSFIQDQLIICFE